MCSSDLEDEHAEQFGTERIEKVVRANPTHSARELMQDIVAAVLDWAGEKGPGDDLTLIVLRALKPGA